MTKSKYKVTVIGGGTGLPVILRGLKHLNADVSAIVTVADDGGSSGVIRDYVNVVPPGDVRNCLCALSDAPQEIIDMFQYRFDSTDASLAGHAVGNLLIAALKEQQGTIEEAISILSKWMKVKGQILPAAPEALTLVAEFEDGSQIAGESKIASVRKPIHHVTVHTADGAVAEVASPKVVEAILSADMIVLGPGSLYTSILPNLMITEIQAALKQTAAEIVYICNIMTQLGETENFTDAQHVEVLHQHMDGPLIDTVLVNSAPVPADYIESQPNEEYLLQVRHDFDGLRQLGCRVISNSFLSMKNGGAYHDTELIVEELAHILDTTKLHPKNHLAQ